MDPWNGEAVNPLFGGGHGTAVTGALGAVVDNAVGIAGTANVCLMPIRDNGWSTSIAAGLRWATDHGADVVSMSFSFGSVPADVQAAIQYAADNGVALVAAAGNSGCGASVPYPASDPHVIAVGALAPNGGRASFSQCGADLELMAPGEEVRTLSGPTGYTTASGTSIATPIAAGAAGLVLSVAPSLDAVQVRQVLAGAAEDLGEPGRDLQTGLGRLDIAHALRVALGEATPAPIGLVAERGPLPGQIRLTWDSPDLGNVSSFKVYRGSSLDDLAPLANVTAPTFTDSGLPEGTRVVYRVTAVGDAGESRGTNAVQSVPQRPTVPLHLRAAFGDPGAIVVSWQPPATDGGLPLQGYRLHRSQFSGHEAFLTNVTPAATSLVDTSCPTVATCHYLLSAVNAVAESGLSNEASPAGTVGPVSFYANGESEADQVAVSLTHQAKAPVALSGSGDARGAQAASVAGNATGQDAVSGWGDAHGDRSAASVFGDAEALWAASAFGDSVGSVAVAVFGDADGSLTAVSVFGDSVGSVAVAGFGDADGSLTAVSVFGEAKSSTLPFSVFGECNGAKCTEVTRRRDAEAQTAATSLRGNSSAPLAVSVFGRSEASLAAVSVFGDAQGVAAASVLGDADGSATAASGLGDARSAMASASGVGDAACTTDVPFCVAASVAGDATACRKSSDCTAVSLMGNSSASTAASGTGEADGWYEEHSGCATLRADGMEGACRNPYREARDTLCGVMEAKPLLRWMGRQLCD